MEEEGSIEAISQSMGMKAVFSYHEDRSSSYSFDRVRNWFMDDKIKGENNKVMLFKRNVTSSDFLISVCSFVHQVIVCAPAGETERKER